LKKVKEKEKNKFLEFIKTTVYVIALVVIIRVFIIEAFQIPSASMKDTLLVGDLLLVNKFVYRFCVPERGDIVIFKYPHQDNSLNPIKTLKQWTGDIIGVPLVQRRNLVKRVVGLPGEEIEMVDGQIYIDGVKLDEPYLKFEPHGNFGPYKIPEDNFFMMGDNRDNSSDSRFWGSLPRDLILGKALVIYWSYVPSLCNIFSCRSPLKEINKEMAEEIAPEMIYDDVEVYYICPRDNQIHREWWDASTEPFWKVWKRVRLNRLATVIR